MEKIVHLHIERLPEGVYLATSEEVQGLIAQGRTIQETIEIARDVAKKRFKKRFKGSAVQGVRVLEKIERLSMRSRLLTCFPVNHRLGDLEPRSPAVANFIHSSYCAASTCNSVSPAPTRPADGWPRAWRQAQDRALPARLPLRIRHEPARTRLDRTTR